MLLQETTLKSSTPLSREQVDSMLRNSGYGSSKVISITYNDDNSVDVVLDVATEGTLSQKVLDELPVAAVGLPAWAASYPNEPDPYWKAVEQDQDYRRKALPAGRPKSLFIPVDRLANEGDDVWL